MGSVPRSTFSTDAEQSGTGKATGLLTRIQQAVLPNSWTQGRQGFSRLGEDEQPDAEAGDVGDGQSTYLCCPSCCFWPCVLLPLYMLGRLK